MFIDTHLHLSDSRFDADRHEAILRAKEAGVSGLVEIGESPQSWEKARSLAKAYPGVITYSIGFHPHYAGTFDDQIYIGMRELVKLPGTVAVGEIGLDYHGNWCEPKLQREVFIKCLTIAQELSKPVIIHSREAMNDTIDILKDFKLPGVLHCFSGTPEDAQKCVNMGLFIGIDAPVTYPKAENLQRVVSQIPLEWLLLETDAPYLPPQPYRGLRNEPSYLPITAAKLAEIKGIDIQEVVAATAKNALKIFSTLKAVSA